MKFIAVLSFFAAASVALPTSNPSSELEVRAELEERQSGSITRDDLSNGASSACPPGTLGPRVASVLESNYGSNGVWIQGVGGAYRATLGDNALPRGTSSAAIREMIGLFNLANSKCPSAKIVAGGYSQGAALAAASIEDLSTAVRNKVVGTVLFGYTKNLQNLGRIPNYPRERTLVFCNIGDLVCTGSLIVAAPHLAYQSDASGPAPQFLIQRVAATSI
ncbi:Cutinase [Fusarium oxysporum]|uniref:Cutinase n=1 Tax=Fusarium oxysporum TaxID=5507 RepID=A0A420PQY5_FUSOX|nr:Cutinase [Fusarium oxysporum]